MTSALSPIIHDGLAIFFYLLLIFIGLSLIIVLFLTRKLRSKNRKFKQLYQIYQMTLKGTRDGRFELILKYQQIEHLFMDENCTRILDYEKPLPIEEEKLLQNILPRESLTQIKENIKKLITQNSEEQNFDQRIELLTASNRRKWIRVRGGLFTKGSRFQILGTLTDIDQEERLRLQLQKDSNTFLMIHKYISLIRWEYDYQNQKVYLTRDGYTEHKLNLDEIWTHFHPDDSKKVYKKIKKAINSGETFDLIVHFNQNIYGTPSDDWLRIRGFPFDEKKKHYIGIAEKVTEIVKAREELEFQNDMLKTLIENIPFGIYLKEMKDNLGYYRLWNNRHLLLSNIQFPEDIKDKTDFDLFPEETARRFSNEDMKVMEAGILLDCGETNALNASRTLIHNYKVPVFDKQNQIRFILGISEDISEKKELEHQLFQAQKLDAIGKLAGGISHDVNNMLTGILGFADLLQALEIDDVKKGYINKIQSIVQSTANLTAKLLTFSRNQETHMARVDLHLCIKEALAILKRTINPRIKVSSNLQSTNSSIIGDSGLLINLFLNLGINARDALPEGGYFSIETEEKCLSANQKVLLGLEAKTSNWIKVTVKDNGTGIPEELQQQIFEPFFTTKDIGKGTGLGLSTVYGTVLNHKGMIHLQSTLGEGTEFTLYFPHMTENTD